MNKIIRNYPVERLPAEWRDGLPEHGTVEIELRLKQLAEPRIKLADLVGSGPNVHGSMQEALDHIASLRSDRDEIR